MWSHFVIFEIFLPNTYLLNLKFQKRYLRFVLLSASTCIYIFIFWHFGQTEINLKLDKNSAYFKFDSHSFLIKPEDCAQIDDNSTLFFIGLSSSPKNFHFRQAIRQTWQADANQRSKNSKLKAIIRFFVGKSFSKKRNEFLRAEGEKYGDLVQADFFDTYRNMTLKTVSMFEYASKYCSQASFYFKSDDDCWVNVPKLMEKYAAKKGKEIFVGELRKNAKPILDTNHRWYVSKEEYQGNVFPDYVSGGGYLLSKPALLKVFGLCRVYKFVSMEDIRMGICADLVNVERTNEKAISTTEYVFSACYINSMIVVHPLRHNKLRAVWPEIQALRSKRTTCDGIKEF